MSIDKRSAGLRILNKFDSLLLHIEAFVLTYGIIALAILMIGNVISRQLFEFSWSFTEEVAQTLVVLITFLGLGYCTRKARHIRMTALFDVLPPTLKKILIIFVSLVTGVVLMCLTYWAAEYFINVYANHSVTPALRIPRFLIVIWVPIGLFMCGVEYFLAVFKNLKEKDVYLSIEISDEYEDEIIGAAFAPSCTCEPSSSEPSNESGPQDRDT